jgi:hypothetical protein
MARPSEQIRWTAHKIAQEFGRGNHSVLQAIKTSGIIPAEDGCYSTMDVIKALYGDEELEFLRAKIGDTNAGKLLKTIKSDNLLRNNIPSSMVEKVWMDYIRDITEKIKQSSLPLNERNDLLADLGKISIDKYFENLKTIDEEVEEE